MKLAFDIAVECDDWLSANLGLDSLVEDIAQACLAEAQPALADGVELSLLFCDDAKIRALNAAWRGQDRATNVLSFPAGPSDRLASAPLLGDIALAFETTRSEAEREGKTLRDHTAHLVAHGFLHLLGYDHEEETQAERMERIERAALARIGVEDPYRERDIPAL
ncbi:MAG TPA: rRNA maturation RNase YbeY [Beijerinckiaceae bacterium]|nr:rRNA maturation RNase YbeY [Beijerinckiaceae bacterium]